MVLFFLCWASLRGVVVGGQQFAEAVDGGLGGVAVGGEGDVVAVLQAQRDDAEDARGVHRRPRVLGDGHGDLDVEVLLQGAEKLAAVYPIAGANDRIAALRRRHQQLAANIGHYEGVVAEQTEKLQAMKRPGSRSGLSESDAGEGVEAGEDAAIPLTREDLEREEMEVRELERKKKGLEDRVEGMERDLGGLMR